MRKAHKRRVFFWALFWTNVFSISCVLLAIEIMLFFQDPSDAAIIRFWVIETSLKIEAGENWYWLKVVLQTIGYFGPLWLFLFSASRSLKWLTMRESEPH